ncbi:MAG: serine--tRNA ligase, partial [bacterium]
MLDPKSLKQDLAATAAVLKTRGYDLDLARFESLEQTRRELQQRAESLQAQRNAAAKAVGAAKAKGDDAKDLLAQSADIGKALKAGQGELAKVQTEYQALLDEMPNLPHDSVPVGADERDNEEVRRVGAPRAFDFEPRDHADLG